MYIIFCKLIIGRSGCIPNDGKQLITRLLFERFDWKTIDRKRQLAAKLTE